MQRFPRFSMRLLVIFVTLIASVCAFFTARLRYFRHQRRMETALYAADVQPYPRTMHETDAVTQWILGEEGFSIRGFVVPYDPIDQRLANVSEIDGLQVEGVSESGKGIRERGQIQERGQDSLFYES